MPMKDVILKGKEFPTAGECIDHAERLGRASVLIGRKYLVLTEREVYRLATLRVPLAHLFRHNGRIVTIPVD